MLLRMLAKSGRGAAAGFSCGRSSALPAAAAARSAERTVFFPAGVFEVLIVRRAIRLPYPCLRSNSRMNATSASTPASGMALYKLARMPPSTR